MKMVFIISVIFSVMLLHAISGEDCASKKVSILADILEDIKNGTLKINTKDLSWHVSIDSVNLDCTLVNSLAYVSILHQTSEGVGHHFLCSGSLIQRSLVVTAAGCVAGANLTRLRAAVGLTRMHRSLLNLDEAEDSFAVYNVSEKYYPYRDNYTVDGGDLAILRLSNTTASASGSPRLTVLPAATRLSKHCFTVGWGHDYSANQMVEKCIKPGYKNTLWVSLYQSKYSHLNLNNFLLSFNNILGISKYVAFGVSNVLSLFRNTTVNELPQFSEEMTCSRDEYSPLRAINMSARGKLRNVTMCANSSSICLQTTDTDLINKVDIGSPIFCKIKKPKAAKNCPQQNSSVSQFVLAGVVTSKKFKDYPLNKYNTTISVMRATNVTQYSDFILSVLNRKN